MIFILIIIYVIGWGIMAYIIKDIIQEKNNANALFLDTKRDAITFKARGIKFWHPKKGFIHKQLTVKQWKELIK